jgi:hypothetical protein
MKNVYFHTCSNHHMSYDDDESELNEYGRRKDGSDWDADRKEMARDDLMDEINSEPDKLTRIEKKLDLILEKLGI